MDLPIDNLTTADPYSSLSANQGVVIKGMIDELDVRVDTLENSSSNIQALNSTEIQGIIE